MIEVGITHRGNYILEVLDDNNDEWIYAGQCANERSLKSDIALLRTAGYSEFRYHDPNGVLHYDA